MATLFNSAGAGDSGNTNTLSWSHTTAGTNRHAIIAVGSTNQTVSSVTFGAISCSLITGTNVGQSNEDIELWQTDSEPASGSNTVTVNMAGMSQCAGNSFNFFNVDQTTPTGNVDTNTAAAATSSTSTPFGLGAALVFDFMRLNVTATPNSKQTSRWSLTASGNTYVASTKISSHNDDPMTWTFASSDVAHAAVVVRPDTLRRVWIQNAT